MIKTSENSPKFFTVKILTAPYIVPVSEPIIKNGAIVVEGNTIIDIGSAIDMRKKHHGAVWRDFPDSILMPGLINAHIHLEYSSLGPLTKRVDFIPWIIDLIKRQNELSRDDISVSISNTIDKLISYGVTSVGEVSKSGLSLAPLIKSGLKGVYYTELVAVDESRRAEAIPAFEGAYNEARRALKNSALTSGIFAHSPYTLSTEILRYVSNIIKRSPAPCAIHAAEHPAENEFISRGAGALADFVNMFELKSFPSQGKWSDTFSYLEDMGIITQKTTLVHGVHFREFDFPAISKTGAGIVLCPRSNHLLKNGDFPFIASQKYDLKTGLGTDSLASNYSLDMFDEIRFLKARMNLPDDIDSRLIELATIGGARVLGIDEATGSLARGKSADVIAVRIRAGANSKSFSPVDYLVSRACASDVAFSMIDGVVILPN